jgi:hypothetical protein
MILDGKQKIKNKRSNKIQICEVFCFLIVFGAYVFNETI